MTENNSSKSFWLTSNGLAALLLIAGAIYFLLTEHRAHVIALLPWSILLLCPLIHIFMHGGHAHGEHGHDEEQHGSDGTDESYKKGYDEGKRDARDQSTAGNMNDSGDKHARH